MNARKTATLSAVLFSLAVSAGSVSAQGIRLGADIGPAFTTDEFSSNWKTGYCLGTHFFILPFPTTMIQLGARIAYDRWSSEDKSLTTLLPIPDPTASASGFQSYWEISPTVRLASDIKSSPLNAFVEAGYGLFVRNGQILVHSTANTTDISATYKSESVGATVGAGVSLGLPYYVSIEILPLYHFVFVPNSRSEFLTLSAAVMLGI